MVVESKQETVDNTAETKSSGWGEVGEIAISLLRSETSSCIDVDTPPLCSCRVMGVGF